MKYFAGAQFEFDIAVRQSIQVRNAVAGEPSDKGHDGRFRGYALVVVLVEHPDLATFSCREGAGPSITSKSSFIISLRSFTIQKSFLALDAPSISGQ
jgi:hypothetical protein